MTNINYMSSYGLGTLLTTIILTYLIILACYWALKAYSRYRILKFYNYRNPIFAWFPILSMYALSDAICEDQEKIDVCGIEMPAELFKMWVILNPALTFLIPCAGAILTFAIRIICKGRVFTRIYARCEEKTETETELIGYLSGIFDIVGVFKCLLYPSNIKIKSSSPNIKSPEF